MIPAIAFETTPAWQRELAASITDPGELCRLLRLDPEVLESARAAQRGFGLRVTQSYLRRIRPGDPQDPLLLQVLPTDLELQPQPPEFALDPVGDRSASARPGVLHKYYGRALLIATGACAIHCRYCFRRHFPYAEAHAGRDDWQPALDYLRRDPSLNEVILSGGDPLVLRDDKLAALAQSLSAIPQLRRLRIHSRVPVVLPSRVDARLLDWISRSRLRIVLVLHVNHARELAADVLEALTQLRQSGALLLNQSVLLRGVNDSAATLAELSETLFDAGVQPYYLHLLDRVRGAAHFDLPQAEAEALYRELRARLPGFLVPRLVREVAGEPYKSLV
ncbi:MAG: EF-P beta-lysylation protein EpmB [Thiotrichales bacterium]